MLERARAARANLPSRVARPADLAEVRIPVPDRPGVLAEVTTLAAELGVNIADLEIAHSAEGNRGVVILLVEAANADLLPRRAHGPRLPAVGAAPRMSGALAIQPLSAPPDVDIRVPGSKSITNRALVAARWPTGVSTLRRRAVRRRHRGDARLALQRLGVQIDIDRDAEVVVVHGTSGEIPATEADLDARQSGTTARFLLPMLAVGHGRFRLDGDPQLRARPLGPGIDALRQLGVRIVEEGAAGHLPVVVEADGLPGGRVTIDGDVSSQFLSGLMLAAPCARGDLTIEVAGRQVSRPYVDMTTAVARQFGATGGASGYRGCGRHDRAGRERGFVLLRRCRDHRRPRDRARPRIRLGAGRPEVRRCALAHGR